MGLAFCPGQSRSFHNTRKSTRSVFRVHLSRPRPATTNTEKRDVLGSLSNLVQVGKCSLKMPIKIFVSAIPSITRK